MYCIRTNINESSIEFVWVMLSGRLAVAPSVQKGYGIIGSSSASSD